MPDYRLLAPHRINKEWRAVGETVSLPQQTGDWLVEQGKAAHVDAIPAPAAPLEPGAFVQSRPPRFDPPPRFATCCNWPKRS